MSVSTSKTMVLTDELGNQFHLYNNFASGGEGGVYYVKEAPDEVAKIYNMATLSSEADRKTKEKKIALMVDCPVQNPSSRGQLLIAWPTRRLYLNSKFCGFMMPKVDNTFMIYDVYRTDSRMVQFPSFTWKTLMAYSYNLALAVSRVHAAGHSVGDMNPKNIVINDKGQVCLIDTDSFNVTNPVTKEEFRCCVGIGECLAPELQGRNLKIGANRFSAASDNFSLAMTIFKLLMNGHHPFNCKVVKNKTSSVSCTPLEEGIVKGRSPYIRSFPGITVPPSAPDFEMLPAEIKDMFKRTFTYTETSLNISGRPTADEWVDVLYRVLVRDEFNRCARNKKHIWPKGYNRCPWCAIGI